MDRDSIMWRSMKDDPYKKLRSKANDKRKEWIKNLRNKNPSNEVLTHATQHLTDRNKFLLESSAILDTKAAHFITILTVALPMTLALYAAELLELLTFLTFACSSIVAIVFNFVTLKARPYQSGMITEEDISKTKKNLHNLPLKERMFWGLNLLIYAITLNSKLNQKKAKWFHGSCYVLAIGTGIAVLILVLSEIVGVDWV